MIALRLQAYLQLPKSPTATGCSVPVTGKGHDAHRSHTLPTPRAQSLPQTLWNFCLHVCLVNPFWLRRGPGSTFISQH